MNNPDLHSFHMLVLGLGYSIYVPIKVVLFGISSVISIVDNRLVEKMRGYHCLQACQSYELTSENENNYRAIRITMFMPNAHLTFVRFFKQ
jgi:hypothetical protein